MSKRLFSPLPLLLLAALLLGAVALHSAKFKIQPEESSMRVTGTSTLHDWSCAVQSLSGTLQLTPASSSSEATDPTTDNGSSEPLTAISEVRVTVPVEQIDCDNGTMNSKMRDALKADAYPIVLYDLESASIQPLPDSSAAWFQVNATGELNIAGTRRTLDMTVKGQRLNDGRYRFVGEKSFLLSEFDIKRPSAMLGAIKTGDRVTVHFDVVAAR